MNVSCCNYHYKNEYLVPELSLLIIISCTETSLLDEYRVLKLSYTNEYLALELSLLTIISCTETSLLILMSCTEVVCTEISFLTTCWICSLTWLSYTETIPTDHIFCTNILLLATYFVLKWSLLTEYFAVEYSFWVFCSGISLLTEYSALEYSYWIDIL